MSIPPINPFAGMAAQQPSDDQRQIQREREQAGDVAKLTSSSETDAEAAATAASSDRDADGRQAWQGPPPPPAEEKSEPEVPGRSRGVDLITGKLIDLDG